MAMLKRVAIALALVGAASATTYTVEKEADFYKTLYSTSPGDTVAVKCDLKQGIVIDQGGKSGRPISIVSVGGRHLMCGKESHDQVAITASYVTLKGFDAQCKSMKVEGSGVNLDSLAGATDSYVIELKGSNIQAINLTGKTVIVSGNNNLIKSSTLATAQISGNGNDLSQSKISPASNSDNIIQISGDKNKVLGCKIKHSVCTEKDNSAIKVTGDDNTIQSNNFEMNAYNCWVTTASAYQGIIENSKNGGNTYAQNTCAWTRVKPGQSPYFVYMEKVNANDKVCASNSVDNGSISNVEVNRRC